MRSISNTELVLSGLLSIKVKVCSATKDQRVSFHFCHQHDDDELYRVHHAWRCEGCDDVVDMADLVRGVENEDGLLIPHDGDSDSRGGSSWRQRGIGLLSVVHVDELDPLMFVKAFYLEPNVIAKSGGSRRALHAYATLRTVLAESDRALVVRHVLRRGDRARLAVIRAYNQCLVMQTMVWAAEVEAADSPLFTADVDVDLKSIKTMIEHLDGVADDWRHADYIDDDAA